MMLKPMMTRLLLPALSAVAAFALSGCGGDPASADKAAATLYLSAIPDEKITDQKAKFDKLAEYLGGKLGIGV